MHSPFFSRCASTLICLVVKGHLKMHHLGSNQSAPLLSIIIFPFNISNSLMISFLSCGFFGDARMGHQARRSFADGADSSLFSSLFLSVS